MFPVGLWSEKDHSFFCAQASNRSGALVVPVWDGATQAGAGHWEAGVLLQTPFVFAGIAGAVRESAVQGLLLPPPSHSK